jgi:hypothetical protein
MTMTTFDFDKSPTIELDELTTLIRNELARLHHRLNEIEALVRLQPSLNFLAKSTLAQQLLNELERADAASRRSHALTDIHIGHERIPVPPDLPPRREMP